MGELCLDPGIAYRKKPVDRVTITESAKAWDNEAAQALGSSHHRAGGTEAGRALELHWAQVWRAGCLRRPRWAGRTLSRHEARVSVHFQLQDWPGSQQGSELGQGWQGPS